MMTVLRKRPEISTADFRQFMQHGMVRATTVGIHPTVVEATIKLV